MQYFLFFGVGKDKDVLDFNPGDQTSATLDNSCRARRIESVYNHIINKSNNIELKKTYIGIALSHDIKEVSDKVIKILNSFESYLKIDKTKIEICTLPENKFIYKNYAQYRYVLTGSYWWSIAPPIYSLYTLLLRFITKNIGTLGEDFKIGDVDNWAKVEYGIISSSDKQEYNNICEKIIPLMSNLKNIFGKNKAKNYTLEDEDNFNVNLAWQIHYSGIETFLKKQTTYIYHEGYISKVKDWYSKFQYIS